MKCRKLVKDGTYQNIVWFGSYGKDELGNAKKAPNYSEKGEAVRDSLIQRLSVIKGELWYKASYGLPLTEKIKNKGIYDSIIINIITDHPEVVNIPYYNSYIDEHQYNLEFVAYTIYNEEIKISHTI